MSWLEPMCFGLNVDVLAWTYVFWLERRCFGLNLGYLAYHFWLITFGLSVLACHFWLICEYNSWVGFFVAVFWHVESEKGKFHILVSIWLMYKTIQCILSVVYFLIWLIFRYLYSHLAYPRFVFFLFFVDVQIVALKG